jgi:hypothetical protein
MTAKVNLKEGKKKLIGSFLSGNYHFLQAAIAILFAQFIKERLLLCCCANLVL